MNSIHVRRYPLKNYNYIFQGSVSYFGLQWLDTDGIAPDQYPKQQQPGYIPYWDITLMYCSALVSIDTDFPYEFFIPFS